jgi:hypothetical protein
MDLVSAGHNDCEVSRRTSVPRTTVRDWRRAGGCDQARRSTGSGLRCSATHDFLALPPGAYNYLLGQYLGDGCLSEGARGVFRLRIVGDSSYPGIIAECRRAMESVLPGGSVYLFQRKGCVEVSMYSKHWVCLFPQHGPGRKHRRKIALSEWQEALAQRAPESLIRGLIHSDGCRVVTSDRGVPSIRYHFSNRSDDIKQIFCNTLDQLGITWTRPSARDIAVYRKAATARLDEFVGPKT